MSDRSWRKRVVVIGLALLVCTAVGQAAHAPELRLRPELVLQTGHTMRVNCLSFGPANRWLASGGADNTIKIWDVASGRELRALTGHSGWVNALAISPVGDVLASGSNDLSVRIWRVAAGTVQSVLQGHDKPIAALAFGRGGEVLASSSIDGAIKIWTVASGQLVQTLSSHKGSVTSLAFSSDNKFFVSGSADGVLKLWDTASWRETRTLRGSTAMITALAFDPNNRFLSAGAADGAVLEWRLENDRPLFVARHNSAAVLSLFLSADQSLIAATADRSIVSWSANGKAQRVLRGEQDAAELIVSAFSHGGGLLAQGTGSRSIDLRAVAGGNNIQTLTSRSAGLYAVATSPDGRWLASGTNDRSVRLWQTATGRELPRLGGHTGFVSTIAFSADSRFLASGSIAGEVKIWDLLEQREAFSLPQAQGGVNAVAFSPDGKSLVTAGVQQAIKLWDLATRRAKTLTEPMAEITSLSFSPEGHYLAAGGSDKTITLWDLPTDKVALVFQGFDEPVNAVAFSPRGEYVAAAGRNGKLAIWRIDSALPTRVLTGHTGDVLAIAFSPDGQILASAGADHSIRLWQLTGTAVRTLDGAASVVDGLAFTTGGRWLVAGTDDGAMMIWNVAAGSLGGTLVSVRETDDWLVVTPDGLFDGSPASWNLLLWRFGETFSVLPVEAYFNEFFYPGLLADLLADKNPKAAEDITQKDRRQPRISMTLKGEKEDRVAARNLTLRLEVSEVLPDKEHAVGSGARDLRLFRNGLLVKAWSGDVLKGVATQTLETTIPLVAGENRLSAYAFNHDNIKSMDAGVLVSGADTLKRVGSVYVLAIGVSQYENSEFNLNYPVADASEIGAQLKDQQERLGHYNPIVTISLHNAEATKANILLALARLAGTDTGPLPQGVAPALIRIKPAQPEDAVVVYFSGHGTAVADRFYLIPHDLGYRGPRDTLEIEGLNTILRHSISDLELEEALKPLDADQLLLLIDACKSGQALKTDEERRGPMNARGIAQLAYEKGMYILTASQSNEVAFESDGLKHSYLAYALVEEGIKAGAADLDRDGRILLQEWFAYATERVPRMRREQHRRGKELVEDEPDEQKVQRPRVFYTRAGGANQLVIGRSELKTNH